MPLFEWSKNYSININSIDAEHRGLLDLMNLLYDSLSEGKSHEFVAEIIQELDDYAKNHFRNEESQFKRIDYPFLNEHKRLHGIFINEVEKFKEEVKNKESSISVRVIEFLRDWFIDHIMGADKQYVPYFKKHGID
ncbi:MAG: bacteriohemerythrin [Bacteroidales bacterium]